MGCGFQFNFLFRFINSLIKRNLFYLGLGCAKDGATHSELFSSLSTPSRTKLPTSFLKISSCNFGTGYGRGYIGFSSCFN